MPEDEDDNCRGSQQDVFFFDELGRSVKSICVATLESRRQKRAAR